MKYWRLIFHYRDNESETDGCLHIDPANNLMHETMPDSNAFFRKGAERIVEYLPLDEALRRFPDHADEIRAALLK